MKTSTLLKLATVMGVSFVMSGVSSDTYADSSPRYGKNVGAAEADQGMGCCPGGNQKKQSSGECRGNSSGPKMKGAQGRHPNRDVMEDVHSLVFNNQSLQREITEIPGGVRTVTTTTDSSLLDVLRRHPREIDRHLEDGGRIRQWDPLFSELAKYHDKVQMEFRDIENGIEVTSTSQDPEVTKLIRAHAYKVSEFAARGRAAMHESTPLPEDYDRNM